MLEQFPCTVLYCRTTKLKAIRNLQCPTSPCCVRWIGDGQDPYVALSGMTRSLIAERRCWKLTSRRFSPSLHVCARDESVASLSPLISILYPLQPTSCPPLSLSVIAFQSRGALLITVSPRARISLEGDDCFRVLGAICGKWLRIAAALPWARYRRDIGIHAGRTNSRSRWVI